MFHDPKIDEQPCSLSRLISLDQLRLSFGY